MPSSANTRRASSPGARWRPGAPELAGEPRDRILETASALFYRHGAQAVGVDRIIKEAGVAKATFYRHFPSKGDLVVAWLRRPGTRWFEWVRPEMERRTPDPAERLLVLFDVLAEWFANEEFCGCPFVNSAAEARDPEHPTRLEFRDHEQMMIAYLAATSADAGIPDAEELARELFLVAAGAFVMAAAEASPAAARHGRRAAQRLLGAHAATAGRKA